MRRTRNVSFCSPGIDSRLDAFARATCLIVSTGTLSVAIVDLLTGGGGGGGGGTLLLNAFSKLICVVTPPFARNFATSSRSDSIILFFAAKVSAAPLRSERGERNSV